MVALQEEYLGGHIAGLDMATGDPMDPAEAGIWDNYRVKRQLLNSWYVRRAYGTLRVIEH